jgi:hypothetical protein
MLVKNFSKMVHSDQNSHKLNSTVLLLMRMVSATLVVLMVESMFGIKSKILELFLKLMPVKSHLLPVLKVSLYPQVKTICSLFFLLIKVNINS